MKNKIFITGASGGIGFETASLLYNDYDLILTSSTDKGILYLKNKFSNSQILKLDLNSVDEIEFKIKNLDLTNLFGIVHCAGIMEGTQLLFENNNNILKTLNINLIGPIILTQKLAKKIIPRKNGSIIFISSAVGHYGGIGKSIYSASKSGLFGFTKSLSKELGRANIRVNSISPGFIDTKMTQGLSEIEREKTINQINLRTSGKPINVSNLIKFLLLDESNYITGEDIKIDGGLTL